jgi:hypothetical protein
MHVMRRAFGLLSPSYGVNQKTAQNLGKELSAKASTNILNVFASISKDSEGPRILTK